MNSETAREPSADSTSRDIDSIWAGRLVAGYLAATTVLLLVGRARVSVSAILLHVALLAAVVALLAIRSIPAAVRTWLPLAAVGPMYLELSSLIKAAGHHHIFDVVVMGWETSIFGDQLSRTLAAAWPSLILSETLHAAYLSYYPLIFAVPLILAIQGRGRDLRESILVLTVVFVVCFALFIAFPVAGPRYMWASPAQAFAGPFRRATLAILESGSSMGTAFPSSHVAVATAQGWMAVRHFGARGLFVVVLAAGLAAGAVYGGFHYAVDVIAGLALGLLIPAVVLRIVRPSERVGQAKATAPT